MNVDPLAGKSDTGQKGLHDRAGNTQQRNGPQAHGDDEEGFVVIGLFHKESPVQHVVIWGCIDESVCFSV